MANSRLLAIVTILILMGQSAHSQQSPSIDELQAMERMIEDGDWRGLYDYVEANPNLTAGEGALANELRSFVDEVERGQLRNFDAQTEQNQVADASPQNISNASIY